MSGSSSTITTRAPVMSTDYTHGAVPSAAAARGRAMSRLLPILVALAAVHALVAVSLRPYGGNLSALIRISESAEREQVVREHFQPGFVIFTGEGGYDGQAYYYVAMDPAMTRGLYPNPYRYQRILYPLLARALALGQPRLLPLTLYLANLLALAAGMAVVIALLGRQGLSPWWSLFAGLCPAAIMSVQYDLPSPLAIALLLGAVAAYLRGALAVASGLIALAFLAREDAVVVLLALLAWDLWTRRSPRRAAMLAASVAPFLAWQAFVTSRLGALPAAESLAVVQPVPLAGLAGYLAGLRGVEGATAWLKHAAVLAVAAFLLAVGVIVARRLRRAPHLYYALTAAYVLLAVFTVPSQWDNYNGLLRLFYGLFPFLTLAYGVERAPSVRTAVFAIAVLSLLAAVRVLFVSPVYPFRVH
jgi:hypothetical protein